MSLVYGIFNSTSVETTEVGLLRGNKAVDAAFLAKLFSSFFSTGVVGGSNGGGFQSRALATGAGTSGAMQVVTTPGACHIEGYFAYDTAQETRTFSTSSSNRVTAKIFRLNLTDGNIKTMWKDCVRSGSTLTTKAEGDVLPVRSGNIYDIVTCVVDIPAGTTALTADMVTDLRRDEAYCGFASAK